MSRTRSSRKVVSARTQSDSEEDDIKVDRIIRHISDVKSNSSVTSRARIGRLDDGNYSQNSSSASNYNQTTLMDLSTTQSSFERFRWRIWSYMYLKLIQLINFDVWLLSKSSSIGKCKIFLPLLLGALFLILGTHLFEQNTSFSSLHESLSNSFQSKEEDSCHLTAVYNKLDLYAYLPNMAWVSAVTSGLISLLSFNTGSSSENNYGSKDYYSQRSGANDFSEEQMRSFVKQTVIDEISSLKKLQLSGNEKLQSLEVGKESLQQSIKDLKMEIQVGKESLQQSIKDLKMEIQFLLDKFEKLEKDMSNKDKEKILVKEHLTTLSKDYSDNFANLNLKLKNLENSDVFSVKKIVKEAIMLYDADKTGLVDYALESAGGSVLSTRCTETYVHGAYSLWGIPLRSVSNSPRTAIQPGMQPSQCWAFKSMNGDLVIELATIIHITGFSMEHLPLSLSPTGSIDSAPKNFSIYGLDNEKDVQGLLLGEFVYNISGDPLQTFRLKEPTVTPYKFVQLQITSNHGNLDYTCLYRFRVHGRRSL